MYAFRQWPHTSLQGGCSGEPRSRGGLGLPWRIHLLFRRHIIPGSVSDRSQKARWYAGIGATTNIMPGYTMSVRFA